MRKIIFSLLLTFAITTTFAQIPTGYYDSATGTGYPLKTQLYNIIKGHSEQTYDSLWTAFQTTDKKSNGKVWDMYSDIPGSTPPYEYTFISDQCGNYSGEGSCYNREHSFPKSWFNDGYPMYTDLFHLCPTDGYVNGMRSNNPYGETSSPTWTSDNGSKVGPCSYPGYTGTVFEPIDEYKGDFARAYFYMATRYENVITGWAGSAMLDGSSDKCFTDWAKNLLIEWSNADPVSQKEIDRNNAIYQIQHNRNPYIDHPEWVECVWNSNCSGVFFTSSPINQTNINQSYSYTVTYTGDGAVLTCETKPTWLNFSSNTLSGTSTTIGDYSVSFKLTDGTSTIYQNFTITVNPEGQTEIINTDVSTCPPTGFSTYSVASSENWLCTNGYYEANAYGGDVASDDWLIFPAVNFNNYTNEILSFDTWTKYTDTYYPPITLKYSTNYPGTGNPELYSWTSLNFTTPAEDSQSWTSSGDIDLSGITGTNVYIAIQYTSSGTGAGTCALWEVDNILLSGSTVATIHNIEFNGLRIYPNPAKDMINVTSNKLINNYTIHNTIGQEILTKSNISEHTIDINLSTLKSGIYFIQTTDINGKISLAKFIKE